LLPGGLCCRSSQRRCARSAEFEQIAAAKRFRFHGGIQNDRLNAYFAWK
jgi:hypothetical protein